MLSKAKMGGAAEEAVRDTTRNQVFLAEELTSAITAAPASNLMHNTL